MFFVWVETILQCWRRSTLVWRLVDRQSHLRDVNNGGHSGWVDYLKFWWSLRSLIELRDSASVADWGKVEREMEDMRYGEQAMREWGTWRVQHPCCLHGFMLATMFAGKDLVNQCRIVLNHWLVLSLMFYLWWIVICSTAQGKFTQCSKHLWER